MRLREVNKVIQGHTANETQSSVCRTPQHTELHLLCSPVLPPLLPSNDPWKMPAGASGIGEGAWGLPLPSRIPRIALGSASHYHSIHLFVLSSPQMIARWSLRQALNCAGDIPVNSLQSQQSSLIPGFLLSTSTASPLLNLSHPLQPGSHSFLSSPCLHPTPRPCPLSDSLITVFFLCPLDHSPPSSQSEFLES